MIWEFIFIGVISGLLAVWYRNCLVQDGMILYPFYEILLDWKIEYEYSDNPDFITKFKNWIASPLGCCVYCNAAWIALISYTIYLASFEILPSWHWILIGFFTVEAIQHFVVSMQAKYLIKNHPDFDNYEEIPQIHRAGYKYNQTGDL